MNTRDTSTEVPLALPRRFWRWLSLHPVLRMCAGFLLAWVILVAGFYVEENWRGKRAWQQYERTAAAQGVEIEWTNQIPAPVAAEENFFGSENMRLWFIGKGANSLSSRMSQDNFLASREIRDHNTVAEVTVISNNAVLSESADIIVDFQSPYLNLSAEKDNPALKNESDLIPLIVLDDVPLKDAITNLAKATDIKYLLDSAVNLTPSISLRLTNFTAASALQYILYTHRLELIPNAQSGIARIANIKGQPSPVHASSNLKRLLGKLLEDALNSATLPTNTAHLTSTMRYELAASASAPMKRVRILVRSDTLPHANEIREFFTLNSDKSPSTAYNVQELKVQAVDDNSFAVSFRPPAWIAAADYLAWSDPFQPDFEEIRAALNRPYAWPPGDYSLASGIPQINFVSIRLVSQTLAQRAQCHILLHEPQPALKDITLMIDLGRMLEFRPAGRQITLVAAMIEQAVTTLAIQTMADGMRLHAWSDADLIAIQNQLQQMPLMIQTTRSLQFENVLYSEFLQRTLRSERLNFLSTPPNSTPLDYIKNPTEWYFALAPRGWTYQNFARAGDFQLKAIRAFDLKTGRVTPQNGLEEASRQINQPFSPFNFLTAMITPNLSRVLQITAKNQTLVNEAIIVCGLERYRIAHQNYPPGLEMLTPQFVAKLPTDVIGGGALRYRATNDSFVLYSLGWNEKDDGGVPGFTVDDSSNLTNKDWVWPYPAK